MRIVWFSQHEPTSRQRDALQSQFGPSLVIERDSRAFDTASTVISRFKESGADDIVIVAPYAVIRALVQRGLRPIWAQMEQCPHNHPEREVTVNPRSGKPRHYRFIKFCRMNGITLNTSDLSAESGKEKSLSCSLNSS